MVSMKTLLPALLAALPFAIAGPNSENSLSKRQSEAPTVIVTSSRDCSGSYVDNTGVTPGQCHTFPKGGNYGGKVVNLDGQYCVIKFWEGENCSGKATTWYIAPGIESFCTGITDRPDQRGYLSTGAHSVDVHCAVSVMNGH